MYVTYTTDAYVVAREGVGEGDLRVELFTRDFGRIFGKATGARDEKSKLRYSLQTLAHVRVSLVRGVRGWRITGAESIPTHFPNVKRGDIEERKEAHEETQKTARQARIFSLLRLLLAAEEPHEELYTLCSRQLACLDTDDDELALVAALLTIQGFLRGGETGTDMYNFWKQEVTRSRQHVLETVNNSLSANHIVR
jgi:recombinational DNA repair protein (RecF pathway)